MIHLDCNRGTLLHQSIVSMASLAFVHYTLKPSKITIRKPTSKSISRQLTSSSDSLVTAASGLIVERLPVLEATNRLQQNVITEIMAVVRDPQLLKDDLTHTHSMHLQYSTLPLPI